MIRKNFFHKATAFTLCTAMITTLVLPGIENSMFTKNVRADSLPVTHLGAGSIGTGSNEQDASKLPRISQQGKYRFTTDNYNRNHQALDTNDWASNWLWDLNGTKEKDYASNGALSGTAYAFPLCFLMKKDGLRVTKPSMTSNDTNISAYNIKDNDTLGDFNIAPDWTSTQVNVDEITDWSYDAIVENPNNGNQNMKITMTQGSPFTFIELKNSNTLYIEKLRVTFPSEIVYEGIYDNSRMVVFRTNDLVSSPNGYEGLAYQYYALFMPKDSNIEHLGTKDTTNNDKIGKLKVTLPSDREYISFAWLYESGSHNDDKAIEYAKQYRPYAFNVIKDTKADYSFNESDSTLTTTYKYSFTKKAESTADGTIMGILPHQYKNMSGYSYIDNQAITLRGKMKFLKGSSYETKMTYKGILPYMPELSENDTAGKEQLQKYVDDFMNTYMTGAGNWTLANDQGNETYYHGKKLNRAAQVIAAANSIGDDSSAKKVLDGLEANLEDWFTYSGPSDKTYFTYLGEGVGALLGFPTSFNAVDQFNDHHFHYGYFIESAASVGLWDKEWLEKYKDVVKQLIYDIACPYRDNSECVADCRNAYPYLRSFAPYEGHSWASGYEDERTGNNQESTSEAINAWAGIILFGEITGDKKIRDLGIYLYTTEIAAADNYWFDVDQDIYKLENTKYKPVMASMVWGGKVDYATWFGQKYTQGIQICPMQSWSFYYLNGGKTISGKDYIKKFYNYDKTSDVAQGGSTEEWNDMWASYYALADPEYAMNTIWTKKAVNDGESQAHTYHYIQSLIDYGTPDLSYTCDNAFGSVFNKDGVHTFAVYNSSDITRTVTFKDANGKETKVKAASNTMTLFNEKDAGKATYTVEYYAKNLNDNGYTKIDTAVKYAYEGTNVTASEKSFKGYVIDKASSLNVASGRVTGDDSLVLKLYYNRATYTVSYDLTGGTKSDASLYPTSYIYGEEYKLDSPKKAGYDFYGWYAEKTYDTKVSSINKKTNGNLTLYAKWIPEGTILVNEDVYLTFDSNANGTFTIVGDSSYKDVSVLFKVVNTESEAKESAEKKDELGFVSWGMTKTDTGWTKTENLSQSKGKYIVFYFIRYDGKGGYKTEYGYGKIGIGSGTIENPTTKSDVKETTKEAVTSDNGPVEVFGQVINSTKKGIISVVWGNPNNGQTFNVYVDGKIAIDVNGNRLEEVGCVGIDIPVSAGKHTVRITGVLNGIESNGVTADVTVDGDGEIPTTKEVATETPTTEAAPTTEAPTTEDVTKETETSFEPSKITDWTPVLNNSDVSYYICDNKTDNVTVKPQQEGDNIYIAYTLAAKFKYVTLNGKSIEPTDGAYVRLYNSDINADGYYVLKVTNYYDTESVSIVFKVGNGQKPTESPTDESGVVVTKDLEINGYQISTTAKGVRTVYSGESVINGRNVEEIGIVYGLADYAALKDLRVDSDSYYVKNFKAVVGKLDQSFATSKTASSYAMTMKFGANTADEFKAGWMIRVYAKLSDGTYVYSNAETYSIYDVARQLYDNVSMPTYDKHEYLYENILKVVDPSYIKKDYDWTKTLA